MLPITRFKMITFEWTPKIRESKLSIFSNMKEYCALIRVVYLIFER